METIIGALRAYFKTCSLLENGKLNVNYLPESPVGNGVFFSINTIPAGRVLKPYIDGGAQCQYVFTLSSVNDYSTEVLQNIDNSGFFEDLENWMQRQTQKRNLPVLPKGLQAMRLEAQSSGYQFITSPDSAKYQIQARLVYYQKGER